MRSIAYILSFLIALCYFQIIVDGYKSQKKQMDSAGYVIVKIDSASWCPPCQAYHPEIERVKYDLADQPVEITIYENVGVAENKTGYIPWTLIQSQTVPSCTVSFNGYVPATELKAKILAVLECQKN